jgi:hypothetical protein
MKYLKYLGDILEVSPVFLGELDDVMAEKTGKRGVLQKIAEENKNCIDKSLSSFEVNGKSAPEIRDILKGLIFEHEKQLIKFINELDGKDEFEKATNFAKKAVRVKKGFFLKKDLAERILKESRPENLIRYMDVSSIDDLLPRYDVTEIFSSLRFLESDKWMHETFEKIYSRFTVNDFEEREIELRVLGPVWKDVAEKFVAKKHHNVSHLKEFGVIFLDPIRMNVPGKLLRDTALLLHYFHEIDFYSKLFRKYSQENNFAEMLKTLLRGDLPGKNKVEDGEWLIVQRYLWKDNPRDPRLFLPRVNPESMHWRRAERDIAFFGALKPDIDLEFWHDFDCVAGLFESGDKNETKEIVSFDLEDNAMMLASAMEGDTKPLIYHQRESMWTEMFCQYVGGEDNMEALLIEHFDQGVVKF